MEGVYGLLEVIRVAFTDPEMHQRSAPVVVNRRPRERHSLARAFFESRVVGGDRLV